jgi:16S rRNA processing protein RimM
VAATDAPGPETLIPLGQIVNTHATRGELRVRLYNPSSTTLAAGTHVVLRRGNEQQQRVVGAVRPHRHLALLTLESCESMTAAEALIGYEVCVREDDLPPAGAGEIYHYQLLGMTVVTTAGAEIGTVAEIMTTTSNDICVVRAGTHERLIPFVADIVKEVDRTRRRIVIDPLPGLLDS